MRINVFSFVFVVGVFFFGIPSTTTASSSASSSCRPDIDRNSLQFKSCVCETLDGIRAQHRKAAVSIRCSARDWTRLRNMSTIFGSLHDLHRPTILRLWISNGHIGNLPQDVFKGEAVKILHLPANTIETINVNAFRGGETQLNQLDLSRNLLKAIPSLAFNNLQALEHLNLKENMIREIDPKTFKETQMKSLRYLHLDRNQVSEIQI